jgi:hypothetical protein
MEDVFKLILILGMCIVSVSTLVLMFVCLFQPEYGRLLAVGMIAFIIGSFIIKEVND